MALSFANAVGNLFNRLGKLGLLIKTVKSTQSTLLTNMTDTATGVVAQFNGESDIQALMGSAYIGVLSGIEVTGGLAQSIAQATVNRMVYRDNPQISQNLTQLNINVAIAEVIRQMRAQNASVLRMTVSAVPTPFNGTGNGGVIASLTRPFDGLPLENAYQENVLFQCTADSYTGGSTVGNEGFQVTGAGSESDIFAFDWPLGSNATLALNAVNGATDNGAGNLLTNSSFETYATTANVPDNWTLKVGTAGTNTFKETSVVYVGTASLKILGDGSTLTSLQQQFGASPGTGGTLSPQTQYGFNIFVRRDGTAAAAGVLQVDLIDGNSNIINDFNGTANSFTIDLTALTTTYTAFNVAFRTPEILPATQFIRIHLTTALTNGRAVYLDLASLGVMSQMYTSGPFFSVYSGSIPFVSSPIPDYSYCQINNSRGAGATLSTFQTLWAQLFPQMISNEFLLPSSNSPTISDGLIG